MKTYWILFGFESSVAFTCEGRIERPHLDFDASRQLAPLPFRESTKYYASKVLEENKARSFRPCVPKQPEGIGHVLKLTVVEDGNRVRCQYAAIGFCAVAVLSAAMVRKCCTRWKFELRKLNAQLLANNAN
jgi:hypothetical protein